MSAELDIVSVDEALLRFLVAARKTEPSSSSTTRRLILDTSIRLFAEEGYVASSMRMIANACGIRAPSIYEHFANKRELLFAAMTDVLGDFQAFIVEVVDADLEPGEQLHRLVGRHAAWQLRFPARAGAWDSLAASHTVERHLLPEEVTEFTRQRRLYLDVVTSLTAAAFPSPQPHIRARAVLSLCDQIMSWSGPSVPSDEPRLLDHVWVLARAILTSALAADVTSPRAK
ncbi:TetR/AcrR family transcriptional regulator [Mycolicibacterium obuense]|uniref:TetR/AcrR family transcriptional regulator n=1 Tax=Mycolicibacterium obuense TaxID=1807 RepID=UPI00069B0EA7|nr:TetR/AcrR family transcriptional regulator [Mycolicibacterium obuense]